MNDKIYCYKATILSVYDGDSCRADIDLGMKIFIRNEPLRLARINAPEVRGAERPKGLLARDALKKLIEGQDVIIKTQKDKKGKYGRYIAEIHIFQDGNWVNTSDYLVENGHAVYKEY